MTNTSATGGYIVPEVASPPLEGQALQDFLQEVLAGVTGMDGKLVRPRWLADPANIPASGICWCAFGILSRPSDTYPQVEHFTDDVHPDGADKMQRQETLNLLASFYDLGSSGQADYYAALLRDGLIIAQNREVLMANGFDLAYTEEPTPTPSLLKERWLYRVDLPITFRRQIDRTYPVLNLLSANGQIIGNHGGAEGAPIGSFVIGESFIGGDAIITVDFDVTEPAP